MAFSTASVRGSWRFLANTGFRGTSLAGSIRNRSLSHAVRKERVDWKAFPSQKTLQSSTSWYSTRTHRAIQREKPHDLYATLRLTPAATQQQVKDAYYSLSMQFHPDRNLGSDDAHQKFTEITEAYSILGNYDLRKKYDKGLLQQFPGRPHTHKHHPQAAHARTGTFVDKDKVKFNFDEFYKAHYGEALQRQRDKKKGREEEKLRAHYYVMPEKVHQAMIMIVSLSILGLGALLYSGPKQTTEPRKIW